MRRPLTYPTDHGGNDGVLFLVWPEPLRRSPRASFAPGAGVAVPLVNPAWSHDAAVAWPTPYLNKAAYVRPANMRYGNTPPRIAQLRGPRAIDEGIAILKDIVMGEGRRLEFRASAFNALDRHLLPAPVANIDSPSFGMAVNPQGNDPRQIRLGLKCYF